ncbi:MAG: hypothetical protein U5Q16_04100 [Gammaproteobacteria bacterium]|nr:hypothetical protein [Gammaproteobacteria bacterium]
MKTITLSLAFLLLFFWLTPGQNAALAEDEPAASNTQIPVPADLLGELQASFEELASGLASARDAVARMSQQRDAARNRVESLTQANESLRQEMAELRDTLTSTRQDLEQANAERAEWRRKSEQLQARLDSGAAAYDHLVNLRDHLQGTVEEFSGLQADIADVRGELEAPAERKALKERVAALEQTNDDLAGQVAGLQNARTAAAEKAQAAQARLTERGERNQELAETVSALESRLHAMEQDHAQNTSDLEQHVARLQDELNRTERQLEQARNKQQQAQSELVAMRKRTEERKTRIDSLMSDLAALEAPQEGSAQSSAGQSAEQRQARTASSAGSEDGEGER